MKFFHGELRSAALRVERFTGITAQGFALSIVSQQFHKYQRQFCRADDTNCVPTLKEPNYVAKVFGVISDNSCHSVLRRFNNAMAAAGHKASAHEGKIGQGVETGKLADRVHKQNASIQRPAGPEGSAREFYVQLLQKSGDLIKAFWAPGSQQHNSCSMRGENIFESSQKQQLFAINRAPADQHRPSGGISQ